MMKKVAHILSFIAIILLVGLYELFVADFDLAVLRSSNFWHHLIGLLMANALMFWSKSKMDIDKALDTNKEIIDKKNKIKEAVDGKVENDIDLFIAEQNKERKIETWKEKINIKIAKLDRKAKDIDAEILHNGTKEDRKNNKYCRKRKQLYDLIDNEYISKNLPYIKVRYPKIRRYEITTGTLQKRKHYQLTDNYSKEIFKSSLPRLMFTLGFALFITTFTLTPSVVTISVIVHIIFKILSVLLNYLLAEDYASQFVNNTIISDLQYRIDKLVEYFTWKGGRVNDRIKN